MTEITEEQRAAVEWLREQTVPATWKMLSPTPAMARTIFDALPSDLTNPQPVLPTEPGVVIEGTVADGERAVLFRLAGQNIPRPWIDEFANRWGENEIMEWTPRLVPERPQITREQVSRAVADVAQQFGLPVHTANYISALTSALVNGADRA